MPRNDAIQVKATVIEVLPNNLLRVEASNGHCVLARGGPEMGHATNPILPGEKVMLEVFPYDLSKGRITSRQQ
ncbi:MAG: translation initiation factor IF-1 [Chthoniobacterales bacterium]|nr:translation initiation factor IF-1 [Chthoniobacterales bacterium]